MNDFTGEFETHVTVRAVQHDVPRLQNWARDHGFKCLHIVLERGATLSQPMLSSRTHGSLPQQLAAANELATHLIRDGFQVTRIKIEAGPENADVPQVDGACSDHAECYFEHHVKLLLPSGDDLHRLCKLAERHAAHLSRNALTAPSGGREERFVTQRCFGVGRATARRRLTELLNALRENNEQILEVEEEYVVFDSNRAVDSGWITD